jgi:hypothetical protein
MAERLRSGAGGALAIASLGVVMLAGAACGPTAGQVSVSPSATGVVVGTFIREGGPIGPNGQQPKDVRLHGVIDFDARGRPVVEVKVGKNGTFSVRLRSGTYSVSGRSPGIEQVSANGSAQEFPCSQPLSVRVANRHTAKITVTCIVP